MKHSTKKESKKKCAREQCQCLVGPPEEFCSDYCSGAEAMAQPELQCGCGHASCTDESFLTRQPRREHVEKRENP